MRALFVLTIAACGATPPARSRPSANDEPARGSVAPFEGMSVIVDRGCVASATYDVTLELGGAEVVTDGKTDRARCVELAAGVAEHGLLTIDDALHVEWDGPQQVVGVDGCAIAVRGMTIGFLNHKGHGGGDLALGEGCTMKNVRIELRMVSGP